VNALAALALTAAVALTACSGEGHDEHAGHADHSSAGSSPSSPSAPILQPGAPGEAATTIGPDQVPSPDPANEADVMFLQMMIPHHAQALEMSRMAPSRASHPKVKALARRIEGAQGPEIAGMAAWLQGHGEEVPTAGDDTHQHHGMAGMLTEAQLEELRAARGAEFDRLFLTRMIAHHRGALAMARDEQARGSAARPLELADDIIVSQQVEIETMQQLLTRLG